MMMYSHFLGSNEFFSLFPRLLQSQSSNPGHEPPRNVSGLDARGARTKTLTIRSGHLLSSSLRSK